MIHDVLKAAFKMERVGAHIADVDVKLSAADKALYEQEVLKGLEGINNVLGKIGADYFKDGGGHWKITEAEAREELKKDPLPDTIKLGNITQVGR